MTLKIKDIGESIDGSSHHESHPCLLICHGKHLKNQILYSISEKSYYTYDLSVMRKKHVQASNFGWLLLEDYNLQNKCLLNFHSGEKIDLPKKEFSYTSCIFSSVPTDPGCRILFLDFNDGVVRYCNVGDDKYLEHKEDIHGSNCLLQAIGFNGKVYALTSEVNALVEVEFTTTSTLHFQQVIRGAGRICRVGINNGGQNYLVESGGELLFVYRVYVGMFMRGDLETIDFKVFRADFEKRKWVKMKSLGDRALFLSTSEGKCCLASRAKVKENCIYFFETLDRRLYVFDMEDRSISVSLPYPMLDIDHVVLHWM